MNWRFLRMAPWLDTRARFVAAIPSAGAILDIGSSTGETLSHFAELRPDLQFFATDLAGIPENYPPGTEFHRGDVQKQPLPWPDQSMDAITCMHLVEHLHDHALLFREVARLLKPSSSVYFETPHPRTLELPSTAGMFTMNFFDDPTHLQIVTTQKLAQFAASAGLDVVSSGVSRNLLFAAAYPFYVFRQPGRQKYTAQVHWLGWSAYLIAQKQG